MSPFASQCPSKLQEKGLKDISLLRYNVIISMTVSIKIYFIIIKYSHQSPIYRGRSLNSEDKQEAQLVRRPSFEF